MAWHLEVEVREWSIGVTTTATPTASETTSAAAAQIRTALDELSLEEKVRLLTGASTWSLHAIQRIGLDPVTVSDGPIGVRGTSDDGGPSVQLPAPSGTAATWDVDLLARLGTLIAGEARRKGVDVVLAPVVNLQRTPAGGRHFECLAEDPHLTAELAASFVSALQASGVGASVKHFVGNEQETERTSYVSRIDERTLREVYLAPFEALVEAGVWSVMAAYNGVSLGGVEQTATAHGPLLNDLLKGEWGFDGVVVSDWLATKDTVSSATGGLDLVMPGPGGPWDDALVAAVERGDVPEAVIDDKVARILRLAHRVGAFGSDPVEVATPEPDDETVRSLVREATARSIVVLGNDGLLPLAPGSLRKVALVGANAVEPFVQGGGSAFVQPPHVVSPLEGLRRALPGADITLVRGGITERRAPLLPASLVRTPRGAAGILVEFLDSADRVREERVMTDPGALWFPIDDPAVVRVRFTTAIALRGDGRHVVEVGPVGAHELAVDGATVSTSEHRVGSEVVLDSSYSDPATIETPVDVHGEGHLHVSLTVQVIDADAYGRFVRVHLRHRAPGASIDEELAQAEDAAAAADVAIVVVGTNPETESEGWDRPSLALPGRQDELVRRVLAANPRTVVVVNAGAPVILPWLDEVPAVLWWWLPGQEAGDALADALVGATEPSGRLPWTLPAAEADVPVPDGLPTDGYVDYAERLDVGHRGWDRLGRTPAREFGFGLGYAQWRYDALEVEASVDESAPALARVELTNTSGRDGREVVQIYLSADASDPVRPVRWLAGFAVVDVAAGTSATVEIPLRRRRFETWSTETGSWTLPAGEYTVHAGRSSRDLPLTATHVIP
ncbi:beta-glucosidase [Microbacterium sp. 4R-513]|uniref:beta-glucosidase family protein n=1 Tax=Microbacterium sp. 4R-513 TaxID=2567934 RepID=UPI0013E189A4|nr:glycoside hydrolase family 3 C-terminal domain-containing protein [Microbacterium sp. 4R-513]QIG40028.1 beta-glucosidase [Microbacterium sp. 4R-513]